MNGGSGNQQFAYADRVVGYLGHLRKYGDVLRFERYTRIGGQVLSRNRGWARKEKPLPESDAEVTYDLHVLFTLHTLGNQLSLRTEREAHDGAQRLVFDRVFGDVGDEVFVDLDELGTQRHP